MQVAGGVRGEMRGEVAGDKNWIRLFSTSSFPSLFRFICFIRPRATVVADTDRFLKRCSFLNGDLFFCLGKRNASPMIFAFVFVFGLPEFQAPTASIAERDIAVFSKCFDVFKEQVSVQYAFDVDNIRTMQAQIASVIGKRSNSDLKQCLLGRHCPWSSQVLLKLCQFQSSQNSGELVSLFVRYVSAAVVDFNNSIITSTFSTPVLRSTTEQVTELEIAQAFHTLTSSEKGALAQLLAAFRANIEEYTFDVYSNLPPQLQYKLMSAQVNNDASAIVVATSDVISFLLTTDLIDNLRASIGASNVELDALKSFVSGESKITAIWSFLRRNYPAYVTSMDEYILRKASLEIESSLRQLSVLMLWVLSEYKHS